MVLVTDGSLFPQATVVGVLLAVAGAIVVLVTLLPRRLARLRALVDARRSSRENG